ncbi:metal ABC transporter solute-binding protein, Zn/Mn family [Pseudonocardia nigra]|uniref:metal ABC transporter solute-binding protein, Zn/Mn family n=1 Tax=Pseudonocardia nigra TaxID=1921578 RepID=UPI001C5E4543|nr:zinc ABC transporter substrate-binding protein [Pseudonocardia nigra]
MSLRRSAVAALAALALAGCGSQAAPGTADQPGADAPINVVASTDVYGSIADAVGGDRVTVEALITDPAADPHSYESTPADAATVADAAIVVFNGGGYDPFVPQLVEAAGGERTVIEAVALPGLAPAEGEAAEQPAPAEEHAEEGHAEEGHAEGEAPAHDHGAFNEHVWYDLPTVQKVATQLATELGAIDAANAAEYTANAEAFNAEVGELLTRAQAIGTAQSGARVAATEPVAGYLIEAAGLTDVTPAEFAEAIEEDTDPPAAVVAETLALFTGDPVRALIVNAQTQTPTTDQVRQAAETAGVPVVEVTETLPDDADYVTWMGGQIDALAGALDGS